ncbi:hypothetical protein WJX74_004831 [Apatococcus lobatus]|uniref:Uncharacterized protein n=1 Tax=Apatococcus lobatus TaxID=904363 RepID=A0AAW1RJ53_9CHLO
MGRLEPNSSSSSVTEELERDIERLRRTAISEKPAAADPADLRADSDGSESEAFDVDPGHPADYPPWAPQPSLQQGKLQYKNGDFYKGDILEDLRHGNGTHTCSNGDHYTGSWRMDKRDGHGQATFVSGLEYEGAWMDDKTHGYGRARYQDGSTYEGDWKQDHRWGWGTHKFAAGGEYEGEWDDDKMSGRGRHVLADKSVFEGEWRAGERVRGKLTSADGAHEYSGQWRGYQRDGHGTQHIANVLSYIGSWVNDNEEGEGKCQYADGSTYEGQWKAGSRDGKGKLKRRDGFIYDGHWRDGSPEGEGDQYIGQWLKGKRHGKGRCIYASGDKYEGQWEQDKRSGKGNCVFANQDHYKGDWKNDKRHGRGLCKFAADGVKFRGEWEEDGWVQTAAEPALCRAAGRGLHQSVAGQTATFQIEARDEEDNRRLAGGDEFVVELDGPSHVHGSTTDNQNGTYEATYCVHAAGQYSLKLFTDQPAVHAGDQELAAGSPFSVQVAASAPALQKTTLERLSRTPFHLGEELSFQLQVQDAHGNRCLDAQPSVLQGMEIVLECRADKHHLSMSRMEDGAASYTCRLMQPGFHRLQVMVNGKPLLGSPWSIQVQEADVIAEAGVKADVPSATRPQDPFEDRSKLWETMAALQYGADGVADGWDSDEPETETPEQKYIKANPGVPVVENLEDLWKVSKLQKERKARAELQERRQKARQERESRQAKDAMASTPLAHSNKGPDPAGATELGRAATRSAAPQDLQGANAATSTSEAGNQMHGAVAIGLSGTANTSKAEAADGHDASNAVPVKSALQPPARQPTRKVTTTQADLNGLQPATQLQDSQQILAEVATARVDDTVGSLGHANGRLAQNSGPSKQVDDDWFDQLD